MSSDQGARGTQRRYSREALLSLFEQGRDLGFPEHLAGVNYLISSREALDPVSNAYEGSLAEHPHAFVHDRHARGRGRGIGPRRGGRFDGSARAKAFGHEREQKESRSWRLGTGERLSGGFEQRPRGPSFGSSSFESQSASNAVGSERHRKPFSTSSGHAKNSTDRPERVSGRGPAGSTEAPHVPHAELSRDDASSRPAPTAAGDEGEQFGNQRGAKPRQPSTSDLKQDPVQDVKQPHNEELSEKSWFYRDPQGAVQGPFCWRDLDGWHREGYFNASLPVRFGFEARTPFLPLAAFVIPGERDLTLPNGIKFSQLQPPGLPVALPLMGGIPIQSHGAQTAGSPGMQPPLHQMAAHSAPIGTAAVLGVRPDGQSYAQGTQEEQERRSQMQQEQLWQQQMRQEQMRQEQMRQEQARQEQLRQEQVRQEQMRQEQMLHAQGSTASAHSPGYRGQGRHGPWGTAAPQSVDEDERPVDAEHASKLLSDLGIDSVVEQNEEPAAEFVVPGTHGTISTEDQEDDWVAVQSTKPKRSKRGGKNRAKEAARAPSEHASFDEPSPDQNNANAEYSANLVEAGEAATAHVSGLASRPVVSKPPAPAPWAGVQQRERAPPPLAEILSEQEADISERSPEPASVAESLLWSSAGDRSHAASAANATWARRPAPPSTTSSLRDILEQEESAEQGSSRLPSTYAAAKSGSMRAPAGGAKLPSGRRAAPSLAEVMEQEAEHASRSAAKAPSKVGRSHQAPTLAEVMAEEAKRERDGLGATDGQRGHSAEVAPAQHDAYPSAGDAHKRAPSGAGKEQVSAAAPSVTNSAGSHAGSMWSKIAAGGAGASAARAAPRASGATAAAPAATSGAAPAAAKKPSPRAGQPGPGTAPARKSVQSSVWEPDEYSSAAPSANGAAADASDSQLAGTGTSTFGGPTLSREFESWCAGEMQKLTGSNDITLVHFLVSLDAESDVHDYIVQYLGRSRDVLNFADEFLRRKRFEDGPTAVKGNATGGESAAVPTAPTGGGGKKKRGGKKKKKSVPSSMLGFMAGSGDAVNRGEIDYSHVGQ